MERGHVIAQPPMNYMQATIGWLPESKPPVGRGLQDQTRADPLAIVGVMRWSPVPRFPALRCVYCKRVEFVYDNPVLLGPGKDEMRS